MDALYLYIIWQSLMTLNRYFCIPYLLLMFFALPLGFWIESKSFDGSSCNDVAGKNVPSGDVAGKDVSSGAVDGGN